jgi:hypothetical protein
MTMTQPIAAETTAPPCGCGGSTIRLEVDGRLSVHLPGNSPEACWTATPLDSWTCVDCGRTEFFARNPSVFRRP